MQNGAGVKMTPPDFFALLEIRANMCQSFIAFNKDDKCLEEYLKREMSPSLIFGKPACTRPPGSN